MDAVNLFNLATTQAKWLSTRQTAVANNIANASMPGYRASDVEPFEAVLAETSVQLQATRASHFGTQPGDTGVKIVEERGAELTSTGKSVQMSDELVKSGEIRRAFELNTAIVTSFHRMILMTAKS